MDSKTRAGVIDYVKPLAVGVDGVTNFGDVRRAVAAAESIAEGRRDVDPELLFLLAVFSGQEKWISRMGHRSRTELFLASEGFGRKTVTDLFRALGRFDSDPRTPEEEIVHDAVRLDRMGAYGVARSLVEEYRERSDVPEMAEAIDAAAGEELRTDRGRSLAEERRGTMRAFAEKLREEFREFDRKENGKPTPNS
jgi:hypothetical protein